MSKRGRPSAVAPKDWNDVDSPELTAADFARMRPFREVFADAAADRTRARKGEPPKQAISIRLSPDVIAFFKSKGAGWQTRIDVALRAIVEAAK